MKRLLALLALTASAGMLQADMACDGGTYQPVGPQYGQQYMQGQYGQYPYQQGYSQQGYMQDQSMNRQYMQGYRGQDNDQNNRWFGRDNEDNNNDQNQSYGQGGPGYMQGQQGYMQGGQGYGQGQYSQGSMQDQRGQQGQGGPEQDQRLTSRVQDSLRSAFTDKYNNVRVTVNNGRVTLTGTVPSQDDKESLEEKVRDIDGVQDVQNQVMVQPQKQGAQQPSGSRNY